MANILRRGEPTTTSGELPPVGSPAPAFDVASTGDVRLTPSTWTGTRVVLNIFPNIETGVCQTSVRTFNERASSLSDTVVVCLSNDELETLAGFCAAEGLDNVVVASAKGTSFGDDYGLTILDGPLADRLARAIVVISADGTVSHTELVPEIAQEPDYEAALSAL
ncbi:thiol peroxidase [Aestuariimicrobium sp. Y1814]|uniref:thiol peroxidase n=1 Tax=Aestuariimicrobium sp. Y1814 TaxID=3418742 RepID=UPI003DA6FC2A